MEAVGTNLNILLGVTKLVFDELDVRSGTVCLGVEFADIGRERPEERAQCVSGCPLWVRSDEPRRPGSRHRANLRAAAHHELVTKFVWDIEWNDHRTKRASPASTNGLVVNHSHINALVEASLTESIKPRMSLFT